MSSFFGLEVRGSKALGLMMGERDFRVPGEPGDLPEGPGSQGLGWGRWTRVAALSCGEFDRRWAQLAIPSRRTDAG